MLFTNIIRLQCAQITFCCPPSVLLQLLSVTKPNNNPNYYLLFPLDCLQEKGGFEAFGLGGRPA